MTPSEIHDLSQRIQEAIESWVKYRDSDTVLYYASFLNEVDTLGLMENALDHGKVVALPRIRVVGRRMSARVVRSMDDLEPGPFGIKTPGSNCHEIDPSDLDLVLVPGLAFDHGGHRVGFGGGYYDRFLKSTSPDTITLGVAYGFQLVEGIPASRHDVALDYVVTEDGVRQVRT